MGLLEILGIKSDLPASVEAGDDPVAASAGEAKPPPVPPSKLKPPPEPRLPTPENTPLQALHDEALHYDLEVRSMEAEHEALKPKRASLNERIDFHRTEHNQGKLSADLLVLKQKEYDKAIADLKAVERDLRERVQSAIDRAAALRARIQAAGGDPPYRTAHPDDAVDSGFDRARALSTTKLVVSATGLVASAYAIAKDIRYILDAGTAIEGLKRTGKVGVENAVGAAQFALVKHITKSSPVAMVLGVVSGMCSDQANSCDAQEEAKRKEAEEKAAREYKREEMLAVGKYLEQTAPDTVEWVEDTYHIKNRKVWDATVKQVRRMRGEYFQRQKLDLEVRAQALGRKDGKAGEDFTHVNGIKSWKEVKGSHSPDMLFMELFQEYKLGFAEGNAKRKVLFEKARKLGYKDGKAGTKNSNQMTQWPEFAELLREGTSPVTLMQQLQESYREALEAITPASAR